MAALVAVYRDRETADAVAEELHERRGVPDAALRVAAPADVRTAIEAEMEQEAAESWNSGVWGLMTSEMARGALLFGFVGAVIGLVLGLPIGYFLYDDSVSTLTRLAIGALVGVLFGATVGALLGGGMAVHSPAEGLAGERGVPVRASTTRLRASRTCSRRTTRSASTGSRTASAWRPRSPKGLTAFGSR